MANVRSLTTSLPKSPQQLRQDLGDAVLSAVDLSVGSRWDDAIQRAERLTGDTTEEGRTSCHAFRPGTRTDWCHRRRRRGRTGTRHCVVLGGRRRRVRILHTAHRGTNPDDRCVARPYQGDRRGAACLDPFGARLRECGVRGLHQACRRTTQVSASWRTMRTSSSSTFHTRQSFLIRPLPTHRRIAEPTRTSWEGLAEHLDRAGISV